MSLVFLLASFRRRRTRLRSCSVTSVWDSSSIPHEFWQRNEFFSHGFEPARNKKLAGTQTHTDVTEQGLNFIDSNKLHFLTSLPVGLEFDDFAFAFEVFVISIDYALDTRGTSRNRRRPKNYAPMGREGSSFGNQCLDLKPRMNTSWGR